MLAETVWQLLIDPAHWVFEAITDAVFYLVLGVVATKVVWPRILAHFHRDVRHAAGHAATDDPDHDTSPPFVDGPPRHHHRAPPPSQAWREPGAHRRV